MPRIVFVVLLFLAVPTAFPYKHPVYCQPNSLIPATYCRCLIYHPKEEFCESPEAPLPSCCRATEKGAHLAGCACCSSVYGSKRISNVDERGWYDHQPEVEFDISK